MKIKWGIIKKRGNWRPTLHYQCEKTPEETDLAIPRIIIQTKIPSPPDQHRDACMPGELERAEGWEPDFTHDVTTTPSAGISIRLPWRPGKNPQYPEVEEGMKLLQARYDSELELAASSLGINTSGELDHSPLAKKILAPMVARRKILESNAQPSDADLESQDIPF